jgi:predicted solute-binding protein
VLAIWAGRREAVTAEVIADFQASKEFGLAHIADIADGAEEELDLPEKDLEKYLTDNIDFSLDAANLEGLELYYQKAAALGLIPAARRLELADVGELRESRASAAK